MIWKQMKTWKNSGKQWIPINEIKKKFPDVITEEIETILEKLMEEGCIYKMPETNDVFGVHN